jgi:hypothetical protein
VYSRETRGHVLTLSASGWTYNNTFVLYDYETESLWYHMPGEDGLRCISGFYADDHLEEFASTQTRWNDWRTLHPETVVLVR